MTLQQELSAAKTKLEGQLQDVDSLPLLIEQYSAFLRKDMPGRSYPLFPETMQRWLAKINDRFSADTVDKIHQLALVVLMQAAALAVLL